MLITFPRVIATLTSRNLPLLSLTLTESQAGTPSLLPRWERRQVAHSAFGIDSVRDQ